MAMEGGFARDGVWRNGQQSACMKRTEIWRIETHSSICWMWRCEEWTSWWSSCSQTLCIIIGGWTDHVSTHWSIHWSPSFVLSCDYLITRHGTSSFLVTNAQFPEEIRRVPPVTQFYISLDGSTKEGLKKLDRPLFRDYWERFNSCVEAVHDRVGVSVREMRIERTYSVTINSCERI